MVDIVADGYGAGIRHGGTVSQDTVAVPLTGELYWVVAASPDYLACHDMPQRPGDLLRRTCIRVRLSDNSFYKWELDGGEQMVEVDVPGPSSINEGNTTITAAPNSVGLAHYPETGIAGELRSDRL